MYLYTPVDPYTPTRIYVYTYALIYLYKCTPRVYAELFEPLAHRASGMVSFTSLWAISPARNMAVYYGHNWTITWSPIVLLYVVYKQKSL